MLFSLLSAFSVAYIGGRFLKLERDTAVLIGAGTAICGGSAIAAVAPVIGAKDKDIAFSISRSSVGFIGYGIWHVGRNGNQ